MSCHVSIWNISIFTDYEREDRATQPLDLQRRRRTLISKWFLFLNPGLSLSCLLYNSSNYHVTCNTRCCVVKNLNAKVEYHPSDKLGLDVILDFTFNPGLNLQKPNLIFLNKPGLWLNFSPHKKRINFFSSAKCAKIPLQCANFTL